MATRCNSCGQSSIDEIIQALLDRIVCASGGLEVDEALACLRVALSPGGGVELDPMGRLRVTCCDGVEPQPGACVATIDALADFVVGGRGGGASLIHPYGSPQAIQYGLDHALDMIVTGTWSTADGIAVWEVYGPSTPLDVYSTSPTATPGLGVTSSDWLGLRVDAGTGASPTGRNAYAPESVKTPDGGWYGWYAPAYSPYTMAGALRLISQRAVTWADIANAATESTATLHVQAAMRAVSTACTHASTILAVNADMAAYVDTIRNAQITPAIYLDASQTDIPASQIADTGVEWVRVSGAWTDDRIIEFVDAIPNVIITSNSRHWMTQRAIDLGARGLHANDPIYARGALGPEWTYYERPQISYVRRQTEVGHLTTQTDTLGVVDARHYAKSTEFGAFLQVTDERPRNSELIGNAVPLGASSTWQAQVDIPGGPLPSGASPKIGVNFASTADYDQSIQEGLADGYAAFVRVGTQMTGQLEIGKLTPGGEYEALATSTTTAPVPPNEWMSFRLDVDATSITLTRTDGTPYSVTVEDSEYRGRYVAWLANKEPGAGDFVAGVRQWTDADTATDSGTPVPGPSPRPLSQRRITESQ